MACPSTFGGTGVTAFIVQNRLGYRFWDTKRAGVLDTRDTFVFLLSAFLFSSSRGRTIEFLAILDTKIHNEEMEYKTISTSNTLLPESSSLVPSGLGEIHLHAGRVRCGPPTSLPASSNHRQDNNARATPPQPWRGSAQGEDPPTSRILGKENRDPFFLHPPPLPVTVPVLPAKMGPKNSRWRLGAREIISLKWGASQPGSLGKATGTACEWPGVGKIGAGGGAQAPAAPL